MTRPPLPVSIYHRRSATPLSPAMSDDQRSGGDDVPQRQCRRRGITVDVELGAALALADMAAGSTGVALALGPAPTPATAAMREDDRAPAAVNLDAAGGAAAAEQTSMTDDEEMASTRLSSGSSSAGFPARHRAPAPAPGHGAPSSRPRHMLTEAEKEAKRLRRVLANRESARQTILRRQAIRDELARKVADLSSQNETMKKEKDLVMKEYLSLKETNRQLRAQQAQHHHHRLSLSLF